MNEDKSTRYHRLARQTAVASMLWSAIVLGLLVAGGGATLRDVAWRVATALSPAEPLQPGLALVMFVALVVGCLEVGYLPLGFYRGFVLERRYGLSRERAGSWVSQYVKGALIGFVFSVAGAAVVIWTAGRWPGWWWLPAGSALVGASIVLAQLAPVVLLPIFYRFEPIVSESLRSRLVDLASRAGARVLGVYEWKLGERTRKANAALVGFSRTRRILISDTLLSDFSDDEIEVILAHELSHHVHRDLWTAMALEMAVVFTTLFLSAQVIAREGSRAGLQGPSDLAALPVVIAVGGFVSLVLRPVMNLISRSHERRADRYALDLTGKPEAFASALRRLGALNLADEHPSRTVTFLFHTHPPLGERLQAARDWRPATP